MDRELGAKVHHHAVEEHDGDDESEDNIGDQDPCRLDEEYDRARPVGVAVAFCVGVAEAVPVVGSWFAVERGLDEGGDGDDCATDHEDEQDNVLESCLGEAEESAGEGEFHKICPEGVEYLADEDILEVLGPEMHGMWRVRGTLSPFRPYSGEGYIARGMYPLKWQYMEMMAVTVKQNYQTVR